MRALRGPLLWGVAAVTAARPSADAADRALSVLVRLAAHAKREGSPYPADAVAKVGMWLLRQLEIGPCTRCREPMLGYPGLCAACQAGPERLASWGGDAA